MDWSARAVVEGKRGSIPDNLPPILERLKIDPAAYIKFINRSEKNRFGNFIGPVEAMRDLAERFGKSILSLSCSPLGRSEGLTGPVARAFWDRAHRKRTRLYGEDARSSETPWTLGMAAPQQTPWWIRWAHRPDCGSRAVLARPIIRSTNPEPANGLDARLSMSGSGDFSGNIRQPNETTPQHPKISEFR